MNKIYSILIFLIFCFCLYFLMYLIQTSNDRNIEELEKQVELELIETKNKKHIDSH
jgi:preprotein translocase subunit YajC